MEKIVGDLEFKLNSLDIHPDSEIKGTISVAYPGRYDGVVINTQILDSNEHIIYKSYNDKKISQNVSRLFINKDTMPDHKAEFSAVINFEPKQDHEVKFRVSIIEQHKEIESKIIFAKYSV
jgi:outer membrane phospholipase A